MNRKNFCMSLALACLLGVGSANAAFKDIKVDLTNGNLLTAEEISSKSEVTFGLAVADDGTVTRVEKEDASSAITLSGKYHSDEHGWGNFSSTVAVEGPVHISMGSCGWGQDVTIKNAAGEVVGTFNTNDGTCYHNTKSTLGTYYRGGATTLTISGGGYTPYFAVEAVDEADIPNSHEVTFSLGDATGVAPAKLTVDDGDTFTIPVNCTVFAEGKTLTGWNDGSKTYQIGEVVTVTADLTLTPVFVTNTVTLADRTSEVTLTWDFQQKNGAPVVAFQNQDGLFWVAQATVGTEVIDVKLPFSTNPGKVANGNWQDWCQMNEGTTFQVPSCKGATISLESYNACNATIDGNPMTVNGTSATFSVLTSADSAELVIGNQGSYYRYIRSVLPVVESAGGGATYTDEPVSVVFAMNNPDNLGDYTATPTQAFNLVSFDKGDCEVTGTAVVTKPGGENTSITGIKFKPSGSTTALNWFVRPAADLTFTPTRVQGYINRCGTDAEKGVVVTAKKTNGETVTLGTYTAWRQGKADNQKPYDSEAVYMYDITLTPEQQAQLKGTEGFYLTASVGVGNTKEGLFGEVTIEGKVDGTVVAVNTYTLSVIANPTDGGTVSAYPAADEYMENDLVAITATENFGYKFVNWTDKAGNVVSDQAKFNYTVTADEVLTANFVTVNTYELKYDVEGGANIYQIQPTPAPTTVEGKMMYEEGTKVTLTAISNPIMTFTNWSDGQTSSEISFMMDADKEITGVFSASDFVVGWDFYLAGASGRAADFYAEDNDAVQLVLRNADGDIQGWLDKSEVAAGGYEGRPAAVNWRTGSTEGDVGHYYWQTTVNAAAFTGLKVLGGMTYNYNAYTTYTVEASTDGENWTKVGDVKLEGAKTWVDYELNIPEQFNNKEALSLRWIADKTSEVKGTASKNDGIALGATFIIGTPQLIDDGTAPVLVSQVPAEGDETASINGRIVLNFDEKVKVKEGTKATLGSQSLEPSVSGKTVMFAYKNLEYATKYTFTLPAGSVMDLTDNAVAEAITINFTTRTKPEVAKALYDFVVPDDGTLDEAIAAANTRDNATLRYRIFIKNGNYKLAASKDGTKTGSDGNAYPDPTVYINKGNISFIGESMEGVVITNSVPEVEINGQYGPANVLEGIGNGDVMRLQKDATGCYFQNLTMKSSMGDSRGRDIVLNDNSDKTIFKDACLWAYQDTYVSNNASGLFYFEGGILRGRTDFLCGKGDVFYQGVNLIMCEKGGYITAPSNAKKYGYVFNECEITGGTSDVNGNFTLGRPWGSGDPTCYYINTKMTAQPSAAGWNEMSGGWPKRFAEYNSTTAAGTVIDLKDRKKIFADTHENNPVLTREEAEAITLSAVMGDWDPSALTEQAPEPQNVVSDGSVITWDNSKYALLWAICADGKVIDFTTEPTYSLDAPAAVAAQDAARAAAIVYSVRAANEMGGLGAAVVAGDASSIAETVADGEVVETVFYNLQGIRVVANTPGVLVKVETLANGTTRTSKVIVK